MTKVKAGAVAIVGSGVLYCIMFVAGWEGKETTAYLDIGGVPTICYGHTEGVQIGDTATEAECKEQLTEEIQEYWNAVDVIVVKPMEPWQHIAFTSLSYNIGLQAFKNSTLVRYANSGNMPAACLEILRWNKDNGKVVQGLVNRREAEFKICIGDGVRK